LIRSIELAFGCHFLLGSLIHILSRGV
jgi:hypothetical protein